MVDMNLRPVGIHPVVPSGQAVSGFFALDFPLFQAVISYSGIGGVSMNIVQSYHIYDPDDLVNNFLCSPHIHENLACLGRVSNCEMM